MRLSLAFLSLALLAWPASGLTQETDGPPTSSDVRTYGTSDKTFLSLSHQHFTGPNASTSYESGTSGATAVKRPVGGSEVLVAPVNLPDGARVTEIQAVICDTSATGRGLVLLNVHPRIGAETQVNGPTTTTTEAPGCVDRTVVLGTPVQINNTQNSYFVLVSLGTNIGIASVRLGYVLQVSAPGAQVFNDVPPGHPFFQFIQALAASGITTGCQTSPPLFCPDNPVTRGQMAVFLGKALGLHFAAP